MGKGGDKTTTTKVELDPAIKKAAMENLDVADEVAALGYTPYTGNTVAAFSPQQMAAMKGVDQAASAFGMPSAVNWQQSGGRMSEPNKMSSKDIYTALTGLPPPTTDAAGVRGYSALPIYNEAVNNIPAAQLAAIRSFVMDPETGEGPTNLSVPQPQTRFQSDGRGGFSAVANPDYDANTGDFAPSDFRLNGVFGGFGRNEWGGEGADPISARMRINSLNRR